MAISGTTGDDVLLGTTAADQIYGDAGNDSITGGAGNDLILGDGTTAGGGAAEVLVNETTPGQQTQVKLITLANGNNLASWHSAPAETNNGAWTYTTGTFMARYLSPTGQPLGAEFAVSDGGEVVLGHEQIHAGANAVTQLSNGDIVFAWAENSGPTRIYARIFHPDGSSSSQFLLTDDLGSSWDAAPVLEADANGGFRLVYQPAGAPTGYDLWTRSFDTSGTPTGPSEIVNTYTVWDQGTSQMAQLTDGGHVIVWNSLRQNESDVSGGWYASDVYLQRYDAAGDPVDGETLVNSSYAVGTQVHPVITAMAAGGFVISWYSQAADGDGYAVMTRRFNAAGVGGPEVQVNTTTVGDQTRSHITELSNGGYVVVWHSEGQDGDQTGVYYRVFDINNVGGVEMQANITTAGRQGFPDVTATANGGFVIGWTSADGQDGEGGGIYVRAFDANGHAMAVPGDDSLIGGDGMDSIYGGAGFDTLKGSLGDDRLYGGNDDDKLYGGSQNDEVQGGDGIDSVYGGAGDDSLAGGAGGDLIKGEGGNDVIGVSNIIPMVPGWSSANPLLPDGENTVYGGAGDDVVLGAIYDDTIYGDIGDDRIQGFSGNDMLYGGGGNDVVDVYSPYLAGGSIISIPLGFTSLGVAHNYGGTGDDVVRSFDVSAWLYGDAGNDNISYEGNEFGRAYGGSGNDTIGGDSIGRTNGQTDSLFGGTGDDRIGMFSDAGQFHYISGDAGNDGLSGGEGAEYLFGGSGNDFISGGGGHDSLDGGAGHDTIDGDSWNGTGDDTINGGLGNDVIDGGAGNDVFQGSAGRDTQTGGTGDDIFVFTHQSEAPLGANGDLITDFATGFDKIDLTVIDADTVAGGDQAFANAGSTAAAHSVWLVVGPTDTFLRGDVDGNATADFQIRLGYLTSFVIGGDVYL